MVLTTQHCPCGAYVLATFRNSTLVEITLNHFHRRPCHGQVEHLDTEHYWQSDIPTALADRRNPGADLKRDGVLRYRDPDEPPPQRQRQRRSTWHRTERLARR